MIENNYKKSSYSQGESNCVEARLADAGVAVRDSQNPHQAPVDLSRDAWLSLLASVRHSDS